MTDSKEEPDTRPSLKVIKDIDDVEYRVIETIDSDLGVPIYRGIPVNQDHASPPSYVLTSMLTALIREWSSFPRKLGALMPFDDKTLGRMRKRLGMNWFGERELWWAARLDDLLVLSPEDFTKKHGRAISSVRIEKSAVFYVRKRLNEEPVDPDFIDQMTADWMEKKSENIKAKLGKQYSTVRSRRRAFNTLRAAGLIDVKTLLDNHPNKPKETTHA